MEQSEFLAENKGELILVVEDSPTQAEQLRYILEKNRYRVAVAGNGIKALAMIGGQKPDLIISDILMPEMDGFELCRRIKALDGLRTTPIILLTSLTDLRDVIRGLECGANNFITKPYVEEYLTSRISYLLVNRSQQQEPEIVHDLKIIFEGHEYVITSDRRQILDLLMSTYEAAIRSNTELVRTRDQLQLINEQLEQRVAERTIELADTISMLQKEICERERTEQQIREKDRIMMQQSRQAAMGEMIGNIAHQWRQPLNVLGLTIQRVQLFHEMGKFDKEFLDSTTKEAMKVINHMSQTIDDFRNFFSPNKEKENFSVNEALKKALSLIDANLDGHHIRIDVEALDTPIIHGYRNEYAQVLINILMNARDAFLERRIADPRVVVRIFAENGRSTMTIGDNAGGIGEAIIGKIFDPYFTTKGPQRGTGVGLFMSKTIIEQNMNGRLSVRNIVDGAEFRITV